MNKRKINIFVGTTGAVFALAILALIIVNHFVYKKKFEKDLLTNITFIICIVFLIIFACLCFTINLKQTVNKVNNEKGTQTQIQIQVQAQTQTQTQIVVPLSSSRSLPPPPPPPPPLPPLPRKQANTSIHRSCAVVKNNGSSAKEPKEQSNLDDLMKAIKERTTKLKSTAKEPKGKLNNDSMRPVETSPDGPDENESIDERLRKGKEKRKKEDNNSLSQVLDNALKDRRSRIYGGNEGAEEGAEWSADEDASPTSAITTKNSTMIQSLSNIGKDINIYA